MNGEHVRSQLERVLASAAFAGAERPSRFLRFVVERTLDGRSAEIKEAVIGVEALGRGSSFDPKADPIVRVEAGRLRDRLKSYYESEGQADRVSIALPKGGYVPEFSERELRTRASYTDVLKLSILPPAGTRFESFAVSPDGRRLAFAALLNGAPVLWVRDLDSLDARPMIGTDYARYPFWSPDSRTIGFFTPNRLRCVDVMGGPARDIANLVVGRGAAWSAAGVILFCPRPLGILHRVPETGGDVTPVTSLDASRAELAHGFPQFLPDGRHFIYRAMSTRAGESSIRAGSLDEAASKVVLEGDTSAAYVEALLGHARSLAFVSGDALLVQRFDVQRLELHGARSVVVPQVRHRRWFQAPFSVSDDGVLLYQSGTAERQQFSWLDRGGAVLESIGPPNDAISFSLSPDERHVAFYRDSDPVTVCPKVWLMDLARDGALSRLSDSEVPEPDHVPIWSPDGREVLFSRGDERGMRLLRQPLTGGAAVCVLDTPGPKFASDWSADGRFVAYTSQVPDYRYLHVWTVALGSESAGAAQPFLVHAYGEANAYFAPVKGADSPCRIAHTSAETGRDEVFIRDFPDGQRRWQVSSRGGLMPHWRRDGQELFYLALDGTLMAVPVMLGSTVEIGEPRALFATGIEFIPQHKTWMNQYAVGHDGLRFLVNRPVADDPIDAITVVIPR